MLPAGDAPDIADDDETWRRVPRQHVVDDNGRLRPSSAAFADHPDDGAMSALLAREDTVERATSGTWVGYLIAALPARSYRQEAQRIVRDPTPDDASHLQVIGHKTRARQRLWAKSAHWAVEPE